MNHAIEPVTDAAPSYHVTRHGDRLAYYQTHGNSAPGVVFLGGFMSDMTGSKATSTEAWCRDHGRAFLRFDYFGHGQSDGAFIDGTIGRWRDNAVDMISELTDGPQIVIGSSMGGWLMLLSALALQDKVAGLIGIAAAPDFTEDLMWAEMTEAQQKTLMEDGRIDVPSDYGDEPYPITRSLITEAQEHLLMRAPIGIDCPVRLLHGMKDDDVPWQLALRLSEQLSSDDVQIHLMKESTHRMSEPDDLSLIQDTLQRMLDSLS